jgi:hypothetical protein
MIARVIFLVEVLAELALRSVRQFLRRLVGR